MNAAAYSYAWRANVSYGPRLALLALAYMADETGEVDMSASRLARLAGCSTRTSWRWMKDLEELGETVKIVQGGNGTAIPNRWQIVAVAR